MANLVKITVGVAVSLSVVIGVQHLTTSPVVLQASVDSVAGNAEWLALRADGTFDHTSAGLFSETITRGRYTRTGRLIHLDRLPEEGALKHPALRVAASAAFATGTGLWQLGPTGRIDSTVARFRIVNQE